jgi:hypothetical protein
MGAGQADLALTGAAVEEQGQDLTADIRGIE